MLLLTLILLYFNNSRSLNINSFNKRSNLNVKNNLESPVDYQINGAFGTIFSKSFGLIEVENFFNDLFFIND